MESLATVLNDILKDSGHEIDPVSRLMLFDGNCGVCRDNLMKALGFQYAIHKIYFSKEY